MGVLLVFLNQRSRFNIDIDVRKCFHLRLHLNNFLLYRIYKTIFHSNVGLYFDCIEENGRG